MLELINVEREKAGVPLVELGTNIAAQLHAEASLAGCFSSHWGMDGLKLYMRYSLAGGYQPNGENGSGSDYCIKASDGYAQNRSTNEELDQAMEGLMRSPGHRRNILDENHRKVNLGIAWDTYNFQLYQHFEGDYVEFESVPRIENGMLSFKGLTKNGVRFSEESDLGVQLYYDPPTHGLTRGQVSRTYCYNNGRKVASFRWPLTGYAYWSSEEFTTTYKPCPDPYDVSPELPGPQSHREAHQFWQESYDKSQDRTEQTISVLWVTAREWKVGGSSFSVSVDISNVLAEHGPGVYSVLIWGGGVVISEHSIFYEIEPPATYNPD